MNVKTYFIINDMSIINQFDALRHTSEYWVRKHNENKYLLNLTRLLVSTILTSVLCKHRHREIFFVFTDVSKYPDT